MNILKLNGWYISTLLLWSFGFIGVSPASPIAPEDNETFTPKVEVAQPAIQLLGVGSIDGTAKDLSGLSQELVPAPKTSGDKKSPSGPFYNDMVGGISAITWTGDANTYWMLPDRGPLDGAVNWTCRIQKVEINIDPSKSSPISIQLVKTVILKNRNGLPFTGLSSAIQATATNARRLDPEGIRVGQNGNLFVADEYGPRLIEFTEDGEFVRELSVDARFLSSNPDVLKSKGSLLDQAGRQVNRGMEGLALSNDQNQLVGLMQSPLLQDAFRASPAAKPAGINCRMPVMAKSGECVCEYIYQLDNPANKLNEILNCGKDQFLVIERDGAAGDAAAFKKLMLISTKQASDSHGIKCLPHFRTPNGVVPVCKEVLVDLLDERWKLAGVNMPEKIEGLAFGPDLDADRRLLLVASDNDFVPEQKTLVYVFAIPKSSLAASPTSVASSNNR